MRIENGVLLSVTNSDIPLDGNFVIPEGVTEIGHDSFSFCYSLTTVTIPDSVTSIGEYAFYNCSSLKSVKLPKGVIEIGSHAFCGCYSIKSILIPKGVTEIGRAAFAGCHSLTTVTVPKGVTEIKKLSFSSCTSLKSVKLPKKLKEIGNCAFYNCTSLKSVTLPSNPPSIKYDAFDMCSSLTKVNDFPCKYVDEYPMIITSQKQVSEYMIYHGHDIEFINAKEKDYFYVAEKDGFTAHGETIEEAINDLNFKIAQDKLAKEPIYLDTVMTIAHYRAITGACSFGVSQWMQENNIKESDKLTVKQLLPILEKTNAYGFKQFKELIKEHA